MAYLKLKIKIQLQFSLVKLFKNLMRKMHKKIKRMLCKFKYNPKMQSLTKKMSKSPNYSKIQQTNKNFLKKNKIYSPQF